MTTHQRCNVVLNLVAAVVVTLLAVTFAPKLFSQEEFPVTGRYAKPEPPAVAAPLPPDFTKDFQALHEKLDKLQTPAPSVKTEEFDALHKGFDSLLEDLAQLKKDIAADEARKKAAKTPKVTTVRVATGNMHTHTCPNCGKSWSHGPEANGNVAAHTCPQCGTQQWDKTPRPKATVTYTTTSNCPGGVCPTIGRFFGRHRRR